MSIIQIIAVAYLYITRPQLIRLSKGRYDKQKTDDNYFAHYDSTPMISLAAMAKRTTAYNCFTHLGFALVDINEPPN